MATSSWEKFFHSMLENSYFIFTFTTEQYMKSTVQLLKNHFSVVFFLARFDVFLFLKFCDFAHKLVYTLDMDYK